MSKKSTIEAEFAHEVQVWNLFGISRDLQVKDENGLYQKLDLQPILREFPPMLTSIQR